MDQTIYGFTKSNDGKRAAGWDSGAGLHADDGGAVLHDAACRHGCRCREDRKARRRRYQTLWASICERGVGGVSGNQSQQAKHRDRPEAGSGCRSAEAHGSPGGCVRPEPAPGGAGPTGFGLRRSERSERFTDLLLDFRVRDDGPLPGSSWIRLDCSGG